MNGQSKLRKIVLVFALIALGALAFQGFKTFFPVQAAELGYRIDFARAGVHETTVGGLHGYFRDGCQNAKTPAQCSCVVLVHGLGDQAMTWRKVLMEPGAEWTKSVRLYAVDLPGFGKSPPPPSPADYRVRTLAKMLGDALGTVPDCPRWMVVGNSFGGWVSAWLALEWGQSVNKLVLVGSAGMKSTASKELHGASAFTEPTIDSLKEFQRKAYFHPRELTDQMWKAAIASMKNGNSKEVIAAQVPEDDLDTYLPSLHKPTMVFRGEADQIIARGDVQEMARLIPGAIYREAPQCGHLPQKECPAALMKVFNEMLLFGAM